MATLADILRERNTRITVHGRKDYWIVWSKESDLWTIISHVNRARNVTIEFETEDESKAVEQFLALTAHDE